MVRVGFLLFEGFSNMVLSCLLEPLRAVRDQAEIDIRWQVLTPDGRPVRSSSGLSVAPDDGAATDFDLLVVVAGYGYRDHAAGAGLRRVLALARRSRIVIGADSGPWLLAAAGLLDGRRATLHWSLLADFAEAFPDAQADTAPYVMAGRVWTCGGAAGALDLILAFIAERFGQANAFIASSMFLHDADRGEAGPALPGLPRKGTARLRQAMNLMIETIETPLPLPEIAARCGVSLSKLDRLFRAETGMAPGRYFQMLRLSQARELAASTGLGLREIALRCGYSDAAALSKAHRRLYGRPIRQSTPPAGEPARGPRPFSTPPALRTR
ncbi:Transcriptional regulator GlxA family, contains an amidase domain and an AraC-type DNA-binding HTH domain [Paracoccus aminovorans]|uniref:Transcriptional regulator GlxA family, contains an amidase domain and an AraC-type DNA-binding HTH domain n=1 Tax=Paracoccus aminovorans TaxID=34004 RepID=A0A1I3ADQ4_9RHOB|nr:helix-turn-helix domain-containing protein [Paracoccus aminovorans]CQR84196.1 transcriptional regulator [Paracoccus aminovorans]SFH48050.1 Transcriptional regulator GlxA family, contains an amidase domain and an AraC-type DNA-binding HTH domain [Paracoccus aminovorans]